ncbi:unnamed protein product [Rhodiola kirilowii]
MENGEPTDHAPILLGPPFLKTARMKIDCGSGMISMEVEGEVFSFDILKAMKHPMDFEEVRALDALDDLVQEYTFLGENDTLPVIIKSGLEAGQEQRLIKVLKQHKLALGWTLADLRGISPAVCMHRILLEDGAKPSREPQRRLNPIMMEIVQKEIQKLLDVDVIYPHFR